MNHTKTVGLATRFTRLVPRALLVMLTVASLLAADQAIARKAKGGLSGANRSAQAAPASPEVIKPIPYPRRHGAKGRPSR